MERLNADDQLKVVVRDWLRAEGLKMAGPGIMLKADGTKAKIRSVAMDWELVRLNGVASERVTEKQRQTAFEKVLIEDLEQIQRELSVSVAYDAAIADEGALELRKWVQGATGIDDADTLELYTAVLQQYIWQIKRKALGLKVTYHLCPLLVGGQGTGKTTAIKRLNEPFEAFSINSRPLDEMTDPRNYLTLSENLIVFLDEMGRAKRACIDQLKTIITAEMVDYRPMRTNGIEKVEQNCTFIGASNRDTKQVISDTTGMRRFFELSCIEKAGSSDSHALVNSVDIMKIWRSVNEYQVTAYSLPYMARINESQEDLRSKSPVEEYLEYTGGGAGDEKVVAMTLFDSFNEYCINNNLFKISSVIFFRELTKDLGFVKTRTAKHTMYGVNEELAQYLKTKQVNLTVKKIGEVK